MGTRVFKYLFSECGPAHRFAGLGNEDCAEAFLVGSTLIVLVADGMGSSRFAKGAAEEAVFAASSALRASLLPGSGLRISAAAALRASFAAAFNGLDRRAKEGGCARGDLLTTLMVVAFDLGCGFLSAGYVGDGGILVEADGKVYPLFEQQRFDGDTVTNSLFSFENWRFAEMSDARGLAVATDGLYDRIMQLSRTRPDGSLSGLAASLFYWAACPAAVGAAVEPAAFLDRIMGEAPSERALGPFATVADDRTIFMVALESSARLETPLLPAPLGKAADAGRRDAAFAAPLAGEGDAQRTSRRRGVGLLQRVSSLFPARPPFGRAWRGKEVHPDGI